MARAGIHQLLPNGTFFSYLADWAFSTAARGHRIIRICERQTSRS
ncbi:hypothetical protein [Streptomyces sp. NPDC005859]